jgi:hypothetical protein
MSWLTRLYRRLPIIAELRSIRRSLRAVRDDIGSIRAAVRTTAAAEAVRLMHFELARDPRYADPKRLLAHAHQIFSQDGEDGMIAEICRRIGGGILTIGEALVTAENIEALLGELHVPQDFDVLSLDVDRNTYWLWAAMRNCRPRIAVIEYNSSFPPGVDWKVEYRPEARWNGTSYCGARLTAFEMLGAKWDMH